ncbi:MAG: glycoside hydrolase family 10 protein [Phycisphaerae bacterium]
MRASVPYQRLCLFVAALLVLGLAPGSLGDGDPSFRAFWADAFHSGFKSTSQINSLVSRAVTGNYNAIIAEVLAYHDRGAGGHGAYWNSSIVPKASDISGSLDPLAYLVAQAHAADIEVHAWLVPYRASTSWPPNGNSLLASHPEWLMVTIADMGDGPATIGGKYVLDPGSPDVQEYLISIVQELVSSYEIDGINFDYIRYTQTDAGYPADQDYAGSTLARFRELTGYVGTPPPEGESSWNDFRRRTIDELIRRCRAEIPSITSNPRQPLRLTADLITWGDAPSDFRNSSAYTLFQNWKYWMEQGWLDAGIPMNYKREYLSNQAQWYRNWVNAALSWRFDRQMFCGQANYLNTKADSVTQLLYSLNAGADGTSNFSYYATADENMDGNWENDWTWYTYVSTNLFTTAVPTPEMPWREPNTAVEGTLWGRVADPATGEPIDGALIQVGSLDPVETDGNGYYVVTMIPAAPGGTAYDIAANKAGCSEAYLPDVVVLPGEVVRQDIDLCGTFAGPGDMDEDGDVDLEDLPLFVFCMRGPGDAYSDGHFCLNGDADNDADIDLIDLAFFQRAFGQ